jgi:2-octaprenylphenol hydroxylase
MSVSETPFDVLIVGAGLVGAACALALQGTGLRIAVVETRAPLPLPEDESWDSRIYAVSPGSARFLDDLGIWNQLPPSRVQRVDAMHIVGDDGRARLDFNAYDSGLPELAFIVESRSMQGALWQALHGAPEITVVCPADCAGLRVADDHAALSLADRSVLTARLVIGADGAQSWVRKQAGITVRDKDYCQSGVVANFATEKPHYGIARQWFRADGVLAFLPLPGNRISIVWSTDSDHAESLLALPPDDFCAQVEAAGREELGKLSLVTAPAAFPLHLIRVDHVVAPRVAFIGDAAHQVHPLAGQGVNLGFGDAQALAAVLKERGPRDCGELMLLRRYERSRREQVVAMQTVTDGLKELFGGASTMVGIMRNLGLSLTNRAGWLKQRLIRHALGQA